MTCLSMRVSFKGHDINNSWKTHSSLGLFLGTVQPFSCIRLSIRSNLLKIFCGSPRCSWLKYISYLVIVSDTYEKVELSFLLWNHNRQNRWSNAKSLVAQLVGTSWCPPKETFRVKIHPPPFIKLSKKE